MDERKKQRIVSMSGTRWVWICHSFFWIAWIAVPAAISLLEQSLAKFVLGWSAGEAEMYSYGVGNMEREGESLFTKLHLAVK